MMKCILTVAAFVVITLCPRPSLACSCLGTISPCGAFQTADGVFVGTVTSVKQQLMNLEGKDINGQVAVVQVDEPFKGVNASELIFHSYETSCDLNYKEGQRWLFYASYNKKKKAWYAGACGRTTYLERAANDLLYLRAFPGAMKRTRIGGALWNAGNYKPLIGVKVKLIGQRETYEVSTDKNGVYEMYDLPPGQYVVTPETPLNLKLSFTSGATVVDLKDPSRWRVELKENSCAGIHFYFKENTNISGTVFSVDGQPMRNVCLSLQRKDKPMSTEAPFACTDQHGRFTMEEINLGEYYLIANADSAISSEEPFPLVYYPGVFERAKATVVTFASGDKLQDFDIHIPSQRPTRTIEGRLLFSDGRPADEESVGFVSDEKPGEEQDRVFVQTDAEGRFKLKVLEGSKGKLLGLLYGFSRDTENCPQIDKLVKAYKDIETNPIKLEINRDHSDVELRFPFPYCAKPRKKRE